MENLGRIKISKEISYIDILQSTLIEYTQFVEVLRETLQDIDEELLHPMPDVFGADGGDTGNIFRHAEQTFKEARKKGLEVRRVNIQKLLQENVEKRAALLENILALQVADKLQSKS